MKCILTILILFATTSIIAQSSENSCRINVELDVFIDTIHIKKDTAVKEDKPKLQGVICGIGYFNPQHHLKTTNNKFEVVSFVISSETAEGDIHEANVEGNSLNQTNAAIVVGVAKPGTDIYIYCIKARHENGNIYTLKPFSFKKSEGKL